MFDIGGRGQGNIDLRGLAVVAQEGMQVAGVLGENEADDIVAREMRFAAPFADEKGERVGVRIRTAGEELGILEDDRDFEAGLIGRGDDGEVGGVTEEKSDQFDGGARMFADGFGAILPAREKICAAFDANAVSDIVSENDVVTRNDALRDQFGKGEEIFFGAGKKIVGVAGEDELIARMAVVEIDDAIQPCGQCGCSGQEFVTD